MNFQIYIPSEHFIILVFVAGLLAGAYFHLRIKRLVNGFRGIASIKPNVKNQPACQNITHTNKDVSHET